MIWNSTLPISKKARGGFIIPGIEFMNNTLRLDVLEANFYAKQIVAASGYDLLDLHYHMRDQLQRRADDGIHWNKTAHRRISNLILTHIVDAWRENRPGRVPHAVRDDSEAEEENIPDVNNNGETEAEVTSLDPRMVNDDAMSQISASSRVVTNANYDRTHWKRNLNGNIATPTPTQATVTSNVAQTHGSVSKNSDIPQLYPVSTECDLNVNLNNRRQNFQQGGMNRSIMLLDNVPAPNPFLNNMAQMIRAQAAFLCPQYVMPNANMMNNMFVNMGLPVVTPQPGFNWQPYGQQPLRAVNRNLNRRHYARENPYVVDNRNWNGY